MLINAALNITYTIVIQYCYLCIKFIYPTVFLKSYQYILKFVDLQIRQRRNVTVLTVIKIESNLNA